MRSIISLLKDILVKVLELIRALNRKPEFELVWTNPNPTKDFAEQSITTSDILTDCDMLGVLTRLNKSAPQQNFCIIPNTKNVLSAIFAIAYLGAAGRPRIHCRDLMVTGDDTIHVYKGWYMDTVDLGGNSLGDAIPIAIYKIKWGGY